MPIVKIKGPAKTGKTTLARALRNWSISHRSGCLILDEGAKADDLTANIEKLLVGVNLPPAAEIKDLRKVKVDRDDHGEETETILRGVDALPWKNDCMVVVVGEQDKMLVELEKRCPGFVDKFGPVWEWTAKVPGAKKAEEIKPLKE